MSISRFSFLVNKFVDGNLTGSERNDLEALLRQSSADREQFWLLAADHAWIDIAVRLKWGSDTNPFPAPIGSEGPIRTAPRDSEQPNIDSSVSQFDSASPPALLGGASPPASTVLGFLGSAVQLSASWLSSPKVLALTVFGGLGTYFLGLMISIAISRAFLADRQAREPADSSTVAPARIIAAAGCRWAGHSLDTDSDDKLPAGTSRLVDGIVELEFEGGARVHVEGPAEFAAKSEGRIELIRGRLAAYVPKQARGFTVVTPSAELIDLGTEFGVEVDDQGSTDLHVIRGRVEMKPADTARVTQSAGQQQVSAGQAVRLAKGRPAVRIPLDSGRFSYGLTSNATRPVGKPPAGPPPQRKLPVSFAEDFSGESAGPNLELGALGGSPTVDFSGETFAITSGQGSRIYLGTSVTNYASVDFTFEATAILPSRDGWALAFFGMGNTNPSDFNFEPSGPDALAVLRGGSSLDVRDNCIVRWGVTIDPAVSPDTERIRMSWNAATQQALFEVDTQYRGGPFVADYNVTVDCSDNRFDEKDSQLILGGGNGVEFDDVVVTIVNPDPSAPAAPPAMKEPSR